MNELEIHVSLPVYMVGGGGGEEGGGRINPRGK